ncbi:MAG TPA: LemA family protein [Gemmatimonadaceae bacterium]|nr:LemA family protein [Gemmatimonadaceae bacterium]
MTTIIAILGIAALVWVAWIFNRLVSLRNRLRSAWADVDALLKRRADLVPNLVAAVRGYAGHERRTLEEVTEARAAAVGAGDDRAARAAAENALTRRVHGLIAIAEAYPELRASANFLQLQSELVLTENDIASARRYYNAVARDLNTSRETFPNLLIAGALGFGRAEFFELTDIDERAAPDVDAERRTRDAGAERPAGEGA